MKKYSWLDALENASLVGLGVGSVASLLLKEMLFTTTPLSLLVALGLVNRRRYEQEAEQNKTSTFAELDQRLTHQVEQLNQKVVAMPAPEAIHILKKGLLRKDREVAEALYGEITAVQQEMQERFNVLEQQSIHSLRQDLNQLNGRYGHLTESVTQISEQLNALGQLSQPKHVRTELDQLKAEVSDILGNLDDLTSQIKPNFTALNAEITRLDRRISKLSPSFDLSSLRQEVSELIRMIADLVPKRDLVSMISEMKDLQQQQESLRQSVETLEVSAGKSKLATHDNGSTISGSTISGSTIGGSTLNRSTVEPQPPLTAAELEAMFAAQIQQSGFDFTVISPNAAQIYPEIRGMAADYLNNLRSQLSTIQEFTEHLARQQKQLREQVSQLPQTLDVVAIQGQLQELSGRIPPPESSLEFKARIQEVLEQEMQLINQQLQALPSQPQYELLFDLNGDQPDPDEQGILAGSRAVLDEALERTQQRLILIFPWAGQSDLDETLLTKLEVFLSQGKQLDIGWCQLSDRHDERFLSKVRRGWMTQSQKPNVQESLHKLLKLKKAYPQNFQFKILGTSENFLVSDDSFAVLGIADALRTNSAFSELQLKLRTKDPEVIQRLVSCFETPQLALDDLVAHWNRAVTRHDLGDKQGAIADYGQILKLNPDDAITYNYRGLVHYDNGDLESAIDDFTQSIHHAPHQVSAYCNRGFIRYEQHDQAGAISDFSFAIQFNSTCAIAYFYRGMAWQKLEKYAEAVADYGEAIRLAPDAAVAYYYRGLNWQKLRNYQGAIAHLETAADLFEAQHNLTNAQKALRSLAKAKQAAASYPLTEEEISPPQPQASANPFGEVNVALVEETSAVAPSHASEATVENTAISNIAVSLKTSDLMNQLVQATAPSKANGLPTVGTDRSEFETLINFFLSANANAEQDWHSSTQEETLSLGQQESRAFQRKI
ncbi:MAG: tetratricopeptide repeat protein [Timaviella obliquedivisa GSE-PSE-MK23-08B]|jgi:tetratricopeptide (TPR) repeat protein|nr:tetratricopeptide repeat protein [Timaviella obliquedivisa GSE-PSE-MK23-08B]